MKYLVRFTRTETFVHEETVEADNERSAIFKVERGDWSWPYEPCRVEYDSEANPVH